MNWTTLIIVGILVVILVIFIIVRNQKDKKDLEETLNNDYQQQIDQKGDFDEDGL